MLAGLTTQARKADQDEKILVLRRLRFWAQFIGGNRPDHMGQPRYLTHEELPSLDDLESWDWEP